MSIGQTIGTWCAADVQTSNVPTDQGRASVELRNDNFFVAFTDADLRIARFAARMPQTFDSTSKIDCYLAWTAETSVAGFMRWRIGIERWQAGVHNINTVTWAGDRTEYIKRRPPSNAGVIITAKLADVAFDSCVAGEKFLLEVQRDGSDSDDTMAGDAQMHWLRLVEGPG